MTFDELRRKNPTIGFAVYALEPDGPVTLEVFAFGQVGKFEAATFARCVEKAFPPVPKPKNELSPAPPTPHATHTPEIDTTIPEFLLRQPEPKAAPAPADASVFD